MSNRERRPAARRPDLLAFLELYAPGVLDRDVLAEWRTRAVFLTVVVRTQGTRPLVLSEALLCLAAQDCEDFEVIVAGHDLESEQSAAVMVLLSSYEHMLGDRVQYVSVAGGTRGRPIAVAAAVARGRYLVMLDEDDHVQADWVSTLRDLSSRAPGRVLRVGAALRRTRIVDGALGGPRSAESAPMSIFTRPWSFEEHLFLNGTPIHAFAVPMYAWHELGIRVDESLAVLEDWDLLLRCAGALGVVEDLAPRAIYNKDRASGSEAAVDERTWHELEQGIRARHLASPALRACEARAWDPAERLRPPLWPRNPAEARAFPNRLRNAIAARGFRGALMAARNRNRAC